MVANCAVFCRLFCPQSRFPLCLRAKAAASETHKTPSVLADRIGAGSYIANRLDFESGLPLRAVSLCRSFTVVLVDFYDYVNGPTYAYV